MARSMKAAVATIHITESKFDHNVVGKGKEFIFQQDSALPSTRIGGGAVALEGWPCYLYCEKALFIRNGAAAGGAILLEDSRRLDALNSTFKNNTAVLGGAVAILNTEVELNVDEVLFSHNRAIEGGALFVEWFSRVGEDEILRRKRLLSSFVFPESVLNLTKVDFALNHAVLGGGALDVAGLVLRCYQCNFTANKVTSKGGTLNGKGGGLRIRNAAAVVLEEVVMEACNADFGGAIYLSDGLLLAQKSKWYKNRANDSGGAIAGEYKVSTGIGKVASVEFYDCDFKDNSVGSAGDRWIMCSIGTQLNYKESFELVP